MIEFATFFLGLVLGIHRVEVVVSPQVARVEFILDGRRAAEIRQTPWSTSLNFGSALAPHELTAVGFDGKGREVGRVRQWLNLARPPAQASIVLSGETGRRARVSWEAAARADPRSWTVTLDGKTLDVANPREFGLPPYKPDQVHVLRAELDFDEGVSAVAEVVLGGGNRDTTVSELTAVPVLLNRNERMPAIGALGGAFSDGAEGLQVTAIDEGPAEVLVVLDKSAAFDLDQIQSRGFISRRSRFGLGKQTRLRIVWPDPEERRRPPGPTYQVFPVSDDLPSDSGGILWHITAQRRPYDVAGQRLAEAVSVAGITATARGRRRAVVLILGNAPEDDSDFTPEEARRFLQRLGVPLLVWSVAPPADRSRFGSWGDATDVSTLSMFGKAVERLEDVLERERIVWVDGRHLPQNIAVAVRRDFVSLAGNPAVPGASPSH